MAFGTIPLYDTRATALAHSATVYIPVPIERGCIGLQLAWSDSTTSGTFSLELTDFGPDDAAYDAAASYKWVSSGLTITSPAASAAGATMVLVENVRAKRARIKYVTAANSKIVVLNGVSNA